MADTLPRLNLDDARAGLRVQCWRCRSILTVPGALVFSPPHEDSCHKRHLCVACWEREESLSEQVAALVEEVAQLRAALAPFAAAADRIDESSTRRLSDDIGLWTPMSNIERERGITIGDVRKARAALSPAPVQEDQ